MRSEEGRHYTTRVHVSLIKGYHLPEDTDEPNLSTIESQRTSDEDEVNDDDKDNDDQQSMVNSQLWKDIHIIIYWG